MLEQIARRKKLVESYRTYWNQLVPRNPAEYFDRWVFAVCSIVNSWQNNCRSYNFIRNLGYPLGRFGFEGLVHKLQSSRCGVHNRRAQSLWAIDQTFWTKHEEWRPKKWEPLTQFRDRLVETVIGMGPAKVSFVIEMLMPESCAVVCADRHMLRLYGYSSDAKIGRAEYSAIEADWVGRCQSLKLPAPLARHIWWDQLRGEWSTRYWSCVLEDPNRKTDYEVPKVRHRKPLRL